MTPPTQQKPIQRPDRLLDGDVVLTEADIVDLGLEEAPSDAGVSWEEIIDRRSNCNG